MKYCRYLLRCPSSALLLALRCPRPPPLVGGQSSGFAGSLGYAWLRLRELICTPPGRHRHTRAWHATAPTLCRSALSSAAEVLAAAMAGGGAVGYEHRKHHPQAGVRHHPGRPRRAPPVPCALAPLCTHTRSPGRVRTAAAACCAACRARVSLCSIQGAGRALAQARAEALHSPWTGAPVARSAVAGMGAGIGIGMGYTDCKHEFDQLAKEQAGQ